MLSADFLTFFISCMEAMYIISLVFILVLFFTVLKGFGVFYIPAVPLKFPSLPVILMCLGVTESSLLLKSY